MKTIPQRILTLVFGSLFLLASTVSYALPYSLVPPAGTTLPTIIYQGGTETAFYTVTNNTLRTLNGGFVKYFPLNVTQVTSDAAYPNLCGSTFDLVAGGSCTLELTIAGAVDAADPNPHNHLFVCTPETPACAGTYFPLNVTSLPLTGAPISLEIVLADNTDINTANIRRGNTQQFNDIATFANGVKENISALATWDSLNRAVASPPNAGLATSITQGSTTITATYQGVTSTATLNVLSYAYIANNISSGTVSICPINADGTLGVCNPTGPLGTALSYPSVVAINPTGQFGYIAYHNTITSPSIWYCPIQSDGRFTNCAPTGSGFGSFSSNVYGITINPSNTFAYVTDDTNNGYACPVNANGTLGACTPTGNGFSTPYGNAISPGGPNPAGSVFYVANFGNNTVSYCPINPNGTFGTCGPTSVGTFTSPWGLTINPAGTFAYVSNSATTTIAACSISVGGDFIACTNYTSGLFLKPTGMALHSAGTFVYIAANNANNVVKCPININGSITIGGCANTGNGFSAPVAVAVF